MSKPQVSRHKLHLPMRHKDNTPISSICFLGVDGSGKSTLARYYSLNLSSKGLKTRIVWIRGSHTITSILARFLSRFRALQGPCNPYYNICIPPSLKVLWLWLEFASILPLVFTRFILPRLNNRIIIAERGLLDFLVWLILTIRCQRVLSSIVGRVVLSLSRRVCGCLVYVRADLDVLLDRRRGFPEAWSIPLQLAVYDRIAGALGAPVIDTSNTTPVEATRRLLGVIRGGCRKGSV